MYTRGVSEAEYASTGDVAGSLLAELQAGGQLIDAGEFSIDGDQARKKLREFLFADPHAWVTLLIEAAVLGGAKVVSVDLEAGDIRVDLGPIVLAAGELEHLFVAGLGHSASPSNRSAEPGRERNHRRVLQKLALACNAALRLDPRLVEITASDGRGGGHRLCLAPNDEHGRFERIDEAPNHLVVRVERGELARLSPQEPRECELIRQNCVYSSVPIQLNGRRVSKGMEFALHVELSPDELSFTPRARQVTPIELDGRRIGCAGMRYSGKSPAEVTISTNGVLAERFVLGDAERPAAPDFGAIVDVDLGKDLGHNKLLRGPEFDRVMAAIWAVHDRIARADFGAPVTHHVVVGGGLEQFRWPLAAIGIGLLLAAWGLSESGGEGEVLSVLGVALAAAGIAGLALAAFRGLQR